jgi:hypothetical protein
VTLINMSLLLNALLTLAFQSLLVAHEPFI